MSYCKEFGKDKVMFVTKEDHSIPSKIELPASDPPPGLILPGGEINWNCPCLGGMATGPCGVEFRDAFSCFHFSEANPKGSDCYDAFSSMQGCFAKYPTVYNKAGDDDDDDDDNDVQSATKDLNIVSMLDENSGATSMKIDNDSQKIDIDKSINSIIEENTATIKAKN